MKDTLTNLQRMLNDERFQNVVESEDMDPVNKLIQECIDSIPKLYLVIRPSMNGTSIPVYYYTFAKAEAEAAYKVHMKWGEFDPKMTIRELKSDELETLVIATNNYG